MGCGASTCGEGATLNLCKSEGCLVTLCKERKDLIRAARESRNVVSASHVLYLQSILDFGEALDVFLKDAVTVVATVDPCLCSSEVNSPLHSIEGSLTDEVHQGEKDGKTEFSSSVDSHENENQIMKRETVSRFMRSSPQIVTELRDPAQEFHASAGMEYMPSAPPPMNYHPAQSNYWFPYDGVGAHPGGTTNTHYYKGYNYSNYGGGSSFCYPADSSVGQKFGEYGSERPMGYFSDMHQDYYPNAPSKPNPVPSPPMANSTTDYFNFHSFTDVYSSYYSRNIFYDRSGSECPYLNYVLEEEGIPPLEEIEEDPQSEPFNTPKDVKDTQLHLYHGTLVVWPVPVESNEGHMKGGKNCNHNRQGEEIIGVNASVGKDDNVAATFSKNSVEEKVCKTTTEGLGDEKIVEDAKHSSKLKQAIVVKRRVIDIFESVHEINQAFLTAYNSGKEVAEILEAEKIPYLPTGSALNGFNHKIPNATEPSILSSHMTYTLRKKSACKILKKTENGRTYIVKDISYTQGMMTSTLDKLCAWEQKLYKEIKIEEDLRATYEKLNKRWKILVNKGAEPTKIEAMQLKIKRLLPQINVSVSAIRAVSRRIHQTMDEELHPQLCGLIHGLSRMWKSMSQCHQTQVQAALDTKEQHNVAKMQHLDMKHTEELKLKVLKWRSSLCDLITTQRTFATFLVEWLSKFRRERKDCGEADGVHPSSPCRIDDPVVAVLCSGWLHALEATSVSKASEALEEFALALHNLWAKQSEEHTLRLRMEFLEAHMYASTRYRESSLETGSAQELNTAKKILGELKAAHAVVFDQVKYVASSCVMNSLAKVFSASESFCADMSNAYDQINVS